MRLHMKVLSSEGTRAVTERIWGATICPACFAVRGLLEVRGRARGRYDQHCPCLKTAQPQEGWPGFDFNTYLELCRCCGTEPLRSGSRWSPFFCEECNDLVTDFNRGLGDWVIPIGRHSLMHGDALGGDEALIREHAEHFVVRVRGLFSSMDHLANHARARVSENLEALGFPAGREVDLGRYLGAARAHPLDKQNAFDRLREHFIGPVGRDR